MNNSVDNPANNSEIVVVSANDIKNLSQDELDLLYENVRKEN